MYHTRLVWDCICLDTLCINTLLDSFCYYLYMSSKDSPGKFQLHIIRIPSSVFNGLKSGVQLLRLRFSHHRQGATCPSLIIYQTLGTAGSQPRRDIFSHHRLIVCWEIICIYCSKCILSLICNEFLYNTNVTGLCIMYLTYLPLCKNVTILQKSYS